MNKIVKLLAITIFTFNTCLLTASHTEDENMIDGVLVTPTSYIVTMKKMEFSTDGVNFVTFAEGGGDFDIASVPPGGSVGAFGAGQVLPAGTYKWMRATISRYFKITASVPDAGSVQPARTDTNNAANGTYNDGFVTFTGLGVASTDGGTATLQTIPVPIELEFPEDEMHSVVIIGTSDIRFSEQLEQSFTVPKGSTTPPTMRLDFDVTNAVSFKTTGVGTAVMMVLGPHVTMTITP